MYPYPDPVLYNFLFNLALTELPDIPWDGKPFPRLPFKRADLRFEVAEPDTAQDLAPLPKGAGRGRIRSGGFLDASGQDSLAADFVTTWFNKSETW